MKKLILAVAMVTGLALVSHGQNSSVPAKKGGKMDMKNANPEEKAKHETNRAEKELGLNADQKVKWESATLERIKANSPMREKMKGSTTPEERKTLHSQAKDNINKFNAAVNGFLTLEQQTKFKQMKEERKKKSKDGDKGSKEGAIDLED